MAVHPNGKIIATGQYGKDAVIRIWDIETLNTIAELKDHRNGVNLEKD
jgi:hypothetical protein